VPLSIAFLSCRRTVTKGLTGLSSTSCFPPFFPNLIFLHDEDLASRLQNLLFPQHESPRVSVCADPPLIYSLHSLSLVCVSMMRSSGGQTRADLSGRLGRIDLFGSWWVGRWKESPFHSPGLTTIPPNSFPFGQFPKVTRCAN